MRILLRLAAFSVAATLLLTPAAWSQNLYATGEASQELMEVNMTTGVVTILTQLSARPNSLIVDAEGHILYTAGGSSTGTVSMFDPTSDTNTTVATGLSSPRELIFDPGQTSILVSNFGIGQIVRVDLASGTVTPLLSKQGTVDGLAYDAAGHLFAVVNHHKQVVQIDPSSGAILKTLTVITNPPYGYYGLGGLTYDPYTGQLWATDGGSGTNCASGANCLVEIPTDLSSFTFFQAGAIPTPEGIMSDGLGNLFIAAGTAKALEYAIPTNTITATVKVPSAYDVAPGPPAKVVTPVNLYATGESAQELLEVNMSTGVVTVLTHLTTRPDSLIVDSLGRIVYTTGGSSGAGTVSMYDPSSNSNSIVSTGLSSPRDLIFDPGQTSLLVSDFGLGQIVRINLVTGTVTPLVSNQRTVDGLAYDAAGHLFAAVNQHTQIVQIDPNSGAILKALTVITNQPHGYYGLDGLTYDPYTGQLWAADAGSGTNCATGANCLVEIPTDLSSFTFFQAGAIAAPDGIISDGQGNLFIGAGLIKVIEYNISTNTITTTVKVNSVDDVALVPGN
jgi:sugar lactone lactonase YvrE